MQAAANGAVLVAFVVGVSRAAGAGVLLALEALRLDSLHVSNTCQDNTVMTPSTLGFLWRLVRYQVVAHWSKQAGGCTSQQRPFRATCPRANGTMPAGVLAPL